MKFEIGQVFKGSAGSELDIFTGTIVDIKDGDVTILYQFDDERRPQESYKVSTYFLEQLINDYLIYSSPLFQALK